LQSAAAAADGVWPQERLQKPCVVLRPCTPRRMRIDLRRPLPIATKIMCQSAPSASDQVAVAPRSFVSVGARARPIKKGVRWKTSRCLINPRVDVAELAIGPRASRHSTAAEAASRFLTLHGRKLV